jgi:hypothetical protein
MISGKLLNLCDEPPLADRMTTTGCHCNLFVNEAPL